MTGDFGIGSWVARQARITPDRPALNSGARSLGYAELAERIRRLANGLRRLGVRVETGSRGWGRTTLPSSSRYSQWASWEPCWRR